MGHRSTTCFSKSTRVGLMTYDSEMEALRQAEYSKGAYNIDLYAYPCRRCGRWHLSPEVARSQVVKCGYCCGRDGQPKTAYESEDVALETAANLESKTWVRLRPYLCPHYEGWHLTST
jgi:hypothetical protein